jgi:hypothetical protein
MEDAQAAKRGNDMSHTRGVPRRCLGRGNVSFFGSHRTIMYVEKLGLWSSIYSSDVRSYYDTLAMN